MAKAGQGGLEASTASLPRENRGPPPVDLWNPPFCGDIDMRVATDGTWFYQKTPIGRLPLVKLFASVLKREGDKYFLVTPVEKVGIVVDDAPFLAVEMKSSSGDHGRVLQFRTNVDDWVAAGPSSRAALRAAAGERRPQALFACATRTSGRKLRALCSTTWWRSGRNARSAAKRCSALCPEASSLPWRKQAHCGSSRRRWSRKVCSTYGWAPMDHAKIAESMVITLMGAL